MELGELVTLLNKLQPTKSIELNGTVSILTYPEEIKTVHRVDGITPTRGVMTFKGSVQVLRTGDDSYHLSYRNDKVKFDLAVGIQGSWIQHDGEYVRATVNSFLPIALDRQFEVRLYNL